MSEAPAARARVVLIDSGVKSAHPQLEGMGELAWGSTYGPDGRRLREPQVDLLGHGTAAAAAILEHAPGTWLYSVKVFHDAPECGFETILEALEEALEVEPHLVNLSLGTANLQWTDPLEEWVQRAASRGVRLVAPADWRGQPSYPGVLSGVEGVLMDRDVVRTEPVHDGRWWRGSPYPRPIPGIDAERWSGVSFAVANVTGVLAARLTRVED